MENKNINVINFACYTIDEDDYINDVNDYFVEMTGYTKEEANNLKQVDLFFDEDKELYKKTINNLIKNQKDIYIEHRLKRKNGVGTFALCIEHIVNKDGIKASIHLIDMSKSSSVAFKSKEVENKYNKKLKLLVNQATTDSLTGLLRRDTYEYKVKNYLKNSVPVAFVMIDIDNFKNINDTYGHDVGDRILRNVADTFSRCVCNQGIISRLGGDEFSILLVNLNSKKEVLSYLEDIRREISRIKIREDKNFSITVSIGVKYIKTNTSKINYNDLYIKADKLLYKSKKNGKNQINF